MPLLQRHTTPLWGIWKIEERWDSLLAMSDCGERYRSFLDGCKSDRRKAEWLAVRLLLRELIGTEPVIAYRDSGAPYLPDSDYHISISHTKGYAAVILDRDNMAGIDIEHRSDRVQRIKSRFLNVIERDWLDKATAETLLICWSAKETVFKMTGQRVADFRKDILIFPFKHTGNAGYLIAKEMMTEQQQMYRIRYVITRDYVLTTGVASGEN